MKLTLKWLHELVEVSLSASEVATLLTGAGLEVEAVEEHRPAWGAVEVAEIAEVGPHPNADRLQLCRVRRAGDVAAVVCGARNMKAGDRVALAAPGSVLPDDRRIERATIRGVASEGMLCSATELGLDDDGSGGIMILPADAPVGERLVDYFGAEDTVLELGITPNRGDCLSVLGVARELAALTGARLRERPAGLVERGPAVRGLARVDVEAADLCPRYCARVVCGVRPAASPPWLRTRLSLVGLRPINAIVDATNYVMLELGQPLHAFDQAQLADARVIVRRAGSTGAFATLDGKTHALVADDLVIADGARPVALAGIMGGANSEIGPGTSDVLLEAAFFTPATVRRTARRLGIMTDSSYRFERGVDPSGTAYALDRVAEMIAALAGGTVARGRLERQTRRRWTGRPIKLRAARVNAILGTTVKADRIRKVLRAVGAQATAAGAGAFRVVPPPHRFDLLEEVDLIEEVARMTGYDAIAATVPAITPRVETERGVHGHDDAIRDALRAVGFHEMVTLSMVAADANRDLPGLAASHERSVALANPLSSDAAEMRRSLLPGLLQALMENERQGESLVAGFSLGRVYGRTADGYVERPMLGLVLAGRWPARQIGARERPCGFPDLKGAIETALAAIGISDARWQASETPYLHPGKGAAVALTEGRVGVAGALHPDLAAARGLVYEPWVAELDLQKVVEYCPRRFIFRPLPRFPAVQRDVAVVVDVGFQAQQVLDAIGEVEQPLVEAVRVFDQYTGAPIPDGKKSLAYAVSYRAADRTLTDDEVNAAHQQLVAHLVQRLPVEVRR